MESQNNGIQLNASALEFLRESAKWSKFLSIMGFVGIGLMVVAAIFMTTVMSFLPTDNGPFVGAMKGFLGGIYLVPKRGYFMSLYLVFPSSGCLLDILIILIFSISYQKSLLFV